MSSQPPQKHPLDVDPSQEQLTRASLIALATGRTVEQVLAVAISRGASAIAIELLAGTQPPAGRAH